MQSLHIQSELVNWAEWADFTVRTQCGDLSESVLIKKMNERAAFLWNQIKIEPFVLGWELLVCLNHMATGFIFQSNHCNASVITL